MKISGAKAIVTCRGRNFVTLKIHTDQGIYGPGDATLNRREKAVVEDHVIPCRIGMDPAPDRGRCTVVGSGGLTNPRRIADLAALYQVRTACHGEETDAVLPHDYVFEDGHLICGEAPGHSVDIDEKMAAKYPYKPAYLPVVRLEDGTMWN